MTESTESSSSRLKPDPLRRRRRRRLLCAALTSVLILLAIAAIALILALTVFRVRNPTNQILSANLTGISPGLSLPAVTGGLRLNVTLDLTILVHNPNRAAFAHAPGKAQLFYRDAQVGDADVDPGRIPARGSEVVRVVMRLEADRLAKLISSLLSDALAGEVALDTKTRIPGRVTFLGFIKHHAVATSECHIAVGVPDLAVRRQECTQKTKL